MKEEFIAKYFDSIALFAREPLARYECCMFMLKYFETNSLL
jgi:hypothetical protein